MADNVTRMRIEAIVSGLQNIEGLKNAVKTLQNTVPAAAADINQLRNACKNLGNASDLTENALRAQISVMRDLRGNVKYLGTEYKDLTREITAAERKLSQANGGGMGGKNRLMKFGQTAGAVAASGVFGGPEGFVGSAIGGLAAGLPGALAGGAAGAQLGMVRKQLGETADYAASISKLQIALKGVTKDQAEYQKALAASASVTRDFNVPQLEATQGFTRLAASVIGAGGKVADAEVVFRNVTAAIKANGGTAEDVQSSLLALSQVFSKGKVSAEELQGQLGERLPGAVTLFAKATGRTLPQLQKDLQNGVVGLADLMKFITSDQGLAQFGERAKQISASSAEAGARLTTTWQNARLEIGKALQPLGAEIQDALGKALKENLPEIISSAKALGQAIKFVIDNFGTIANIVKFAAELAAANLVMKAMPAVLTTIGIGLRALPGLIGNAAQGMALLGASFGRTSQAATVAQMRLAGLKTSLVSIGKLGLITVGIEIVTRGLDKVAKVKARLDEIANSGTNKFREEIGGTALSKQEIDKLIKQNRVEYEKQKKAFESIRFPLLSGNDEIAKASMTQLDTRLAALRSMRDEARYATVKDRQKDDLAGLTNYLNPESKGGNKASDAEASAAKQQQLDNAVNDAWLKGQEASHQAAMELIRQRYEYELELTNKQRDNWTKQYSGAARGAASQVVQFLNEIDNLNRRNFEAAQKTEQAKLAYSTASQRSEFMGQGGRYIQGGIGPKGPDTYGKHFDIKRSDYGYFDRKSLDQYVQVNGMPLSSGTTVAGGEFGASRWYGKHMGRDYAFGGQAALTLTNGAKWIGNTKTKDGDQAAFMTPDGKVYKILHGKFEPPAVMVDSKKGAAALQRKAVGAAGKATVESIGYDAATESQKATQDQIKLITEQVGKGFVLDTTAELRDQITAQKQLNDELELRNSLEASGMRTEFIDAELEKGKAFEKVSAQANTYSDALQILEDNQLGGSAAANRLRDAIQELFVKFNLLTPEIDKYAKKQAEANDKANGFGEKAKQSIKSYYEELKNFGGSVGNAIVNTFKGLEDQLVNFVVTGKANFKELARSILADMARIALQQAIIKPLVGAIGNLFPGPKLNAMGNVYAKNGIQPFAMGGIVDKPTLFKFAKGTGLMGEAGPEAIIPLKRGADGKLGVSGGGGSTTVNVSVDAKGTSVQGDSNRGDALGRAVAAAVQQELIKQKRPGGLLVS